MGSAVRSRLSALSRLLCGILLSWLLTPPVAAVEPFAAELAAFGERGDLYLLGLGAEEATRVVTEAQRALADLEALLDPDGSAPGGLGRLNAAAGGPPTSVREPVLTLLARGAAFCRWTDGITSLLGGELYAAWGLRRPVVGLPSQATIDQGTDSSGCGHLVVNPEQSSASLGAGSRLDPWGFALGTAVDTVIEELGRQGVTNGFASLGMVARGLGPGPTGAGWAITPPSYAGLSEPLADVWLRDRALAAASPDDARLGAAGEWFAPYLDLRRGRPTEGVLAVLASTQLAVEAQGLATAMFSCGSHAGQRRLGNLSPRPSVLWVLGSGEGRPLLVEYRWAELVRPAPKAP